jgi:hypothetical protein
MAGRIDPESVKNLLITHSKPFSVSDLAVMSGISAPSAYNLVNQFIADGHVYADHKRGKCKMYRVAEDIRVSDVAKTTAVNSNSDIVPANIARKRQPDLMQLTPGERFECMTNMIDMVIMGISPSVMITGLSGIGKTYMVLKRLEDHGIKEGDYIRTTAHCTPQGLYELLYQHQRQIIIFDDCDAIFEKTTAVNILKAALDSYSRRTISWNSTRLPDHLESSFDFEGQIIFVSNHTIDRIDDAVKSRTFVVDLQMSRREICDYIAFIMKDIDAKLSMEEKQEVLNELIEICEYYDNFNVRTFIKACRIYRMAKINNSDWKKSVRFMQ